ncbi:T9SS type A sorting domain-containing protein [Fulvivirgaceae bacterium BMA10]|uniref:T9SS type A sorting domain-containing protein n=1 Tax=Splendidivirga corallicola TaxID=3051826 RepID=A0ABT8KX26_9BACT|nr:T9SS type A sorting domain-containing protein [Fulvivirgaceae bacterium BMA10]
MKILNHGIGVLFILSLWASEVHAQQSINITGGDISSNDGSISYSVGQLVFTIEKTPEGAINQGVQQAYEISVVTGINVANIEFGLTAYPNPTSNRLNVKIENFNDNEWTYGLYDLQGKLLLGDTFVNGTKSIVTRRLPSSVYFLKVFRDGVDIKTFKIIKK